MGLPPPHTPLVLRSQDSLTGPSPGPPTTRRSTLTPLSLSSTAETRSPSEPSVTRPSPPPRDSPRSTETLLMSSLLSSREISLPLEKPSRPQEMPREPRLLTPTPPSDPSRTSRLPILLRPSPL